VTAPLALLAFAIGVIVVVAATERLLDGLVGIAAALAVAPFVASAILSGMEAENVAVGLAAGQRGASDIALGTAFGGAIFLLCVALGLGALIAPLHVRVPRGVVLLVPGAALLAGLPVLFDVTPRWTGLVLLAGFGLAIAYLVRASRDHPFLAAGELRQSDARERSLRTGIVWTLVGLGLIAFGGELVAAGAQGLITTLGLSAGLVGMVVTPVAIEAEEIIRQVIPARRGYADVSAGNAVGTVLWFLLFNLGLIALLTPVGVSGRVRLVDWPFLVLAAVVAAVFLLRGRVGRADGAILLALGVVYAGLHLLVL
jgi:cation:H+ antiporter